MDRLFTPQPTTVCALCVSRSRLCMTFMLFLACGIKTKLILIDGPLQDRGRILLYLILQDLPLLILHFLCTLSEKYSTNILFFLSPLT